MELVQEVLSYIHNNITTIRSARDIARALNISYETFRKNFRRQFHISPGKYIEVLQIFEFAKSLEDVQKTIKEAVPRYYRDPDYANKRFKKYFGISPGQYRKKALLSRSVRKSHKPKIKLASELHVVQKNSNSSNLNHLFRSKPRSRSTKKSATPENRRQEP
jgi:AraC-like DNA-binding protein